MRFRTALSQAEYCPGQRWVKLRATLILDKLTIDGKFLLWGDMAVYSQWLLVHVLGGQLALSVKQVSPERWVHRVQVSSLGTCEFIEYMWVHWVHVRSLLHVSLWVHVNFLGNYTCKYVEYMWVHWIQVSSLGTVKFIEYKWVHVRLLGTSEFIGKKWVHWVQVSSLTTPRYSYSLCTTALYSTARYSDSLCTTALYSTARYSDSRYSDKKNRNIKHVWSIYARYSYSKYLYW